MDEFRETYVDLSSSLPKNYSVFHTNSRIKPAFRAPPHLGYKSFQKRHYSHPVERGASTLAGTPFPQVFNQHPHRRKNVCCVNCGNTGHLFRECRGPVTSFGIVAFRYHPEGLPPTLGFRKRPFLLCEKHKNDSAVQEMNESADGKLSYLMIQRKDSIGYIDFIRGKYQDERGLEQLISEMTCEERFRIANWSFHEIWEHCWLNKQSRLYREEYQRAYSKFISVDIQKYLTQIECTYSDTEVCFPKGRKDKVETNIQASIREFCEETGLSENDFFVLPVPPVEETFVGTNGVRYKHVYYLAQVSESLQDPTVNNANITQSGEVKNVAWVSFTQARRLIRSYDEAKLNVLNEVHLFLRHRFAEQAL